MMCPHIRGTVKYLCHTYSDGTIDEMEFKEGINKLIREHGSQVKTGIGMVLISDSVRKLKAKDRIIELLFEVDENILKGIEGFQDSMFRPKGQGLDPDTILKKAGILTEKKEKLV